MLPELCAVYGTPGEGFQAVLTELGVPCEPVDRLAQLDRFGSVIVVADQYPRVLELRTGELERYVRGGGTAYVEYAVGGFLPSTAPPKLARFERIHTAEPSAITAPFPPLTLFEEHSSWTLPVSHVDGAVEILSYGRVAGTHTAVFGPARDSWPALLELRVGAGRLLYATTALSNFLRGRYRPAARWRRLITRLLASTTGAAQPVHAELTTTPRVWAATGEPVTVQLTLDPPGDPAGPMPVPMRAVAPGVYRSEPLLLDDGLHTFACGTATTTITIGSREQRYRRMADRGIEWYHKAGMLLGAADGSAGVAEGLFNELGLDGVHSLRRVHRGDCYVQSAGAFRLYHEITGDEGASRVAGNLMRLVLDRMQITDRNALFGSWEPRGPRTDLAATNNLFADDNGWISLFALAHGALEQGVRGVEALIRTAHAELGLQTDPWRTPSTLLVEGWEGMAKRPLRDGLDLSAHWNSSAQAAMLFAYGVTGERRYLDVALKGLDHMVAAFPAQRLESSRTCESIRLLLPLAGAYYYTREPRYRETLLRIAEYLKSRQDPASGAIAEWDGRNPESNEAYGVDEASIFSGNGEPVSDQLYAMGYAAMSLPLAHRVTGEPVFEQLATGVLDYLSRIQIEDADARLDGTWMRAFDFGIWEYYGSNCDVGWGPYCVETGWSHAPALIGALLHLGKGAFFPEPVQMRPELAAAIRAEFDGIAAGARVAPEFHIGADGRVYRRQGVESVVDDLIAAGGPVWTENPPAQAVEVYVRGADGRVHHTYLHERLGQGMWRALGDLRVNGDPAVAFNPAADAVEVYVVGQDGAVYHTTLLDARAGHTEWEAVGALSFTGDLTVAYDAELATVRIVARASDGRLYRTIKANRWHRPWAPVGQQSEHLAWRVA